MALIITNVTLDGRSFVYTRSDAGFYILQDSTGNIYDGAYDLADHPQTYTETDQPIDPDAAPVDPDPYAEAGRILLGVE